MKPASVFPIVSVALAASLLAMSYARAEIPKQSKEKLQALASHALTGTIERVYEHKEKRGDYEFTHGVAEVAVERVDKGTDVVANDRVFVRFWRQKWIGEGNSPPGHSGHWNIPARTDTAEIYVKGDRKTGFDVLSPNGFFKITRLKTVETKPSP